MIHNDYSLAIHIPACQLEVGGWDVDGEVVHSRSVGWVTNVEWLGYGCWSVGRRIVVREKKGLGAAVRFRVNEILFRGFLFYF